MAEPGRRGRWAAVGAVLAGAPISAEYLSAYLPVTGFVPALLTGLLVLGPLYGGAALLIREVAVRRSLGWTGILLLAAAFGLAMPGLVDLALFAEERPDIEYWQPMRETTYIAVLDISGYTALTWVSGHVLMSVGAPLAVLDAVAPRLRGRPLLSRTGIVVLSVLWLLAAVIIRMDNAEIYGYQPSFAQTITVAVAVVLLAGLALGPLGAATTGNAGRSVPPWVVLVAAVLALLAYDMAPWTWTGVAVVAGLLLAAPVIIGYCATTGNWSARHIGALGAGALIGRALIGFLTPVPDGVNTAAKLAHNCVLLAAVMVLAWFAVRPGQTHSARSAATPDRPRRSRTDPGEPTSCP